MDVLISVALGVLAIVAVAAWALGVNFIEPVTGVLAIRISRRIDAIRRRRSIRKLPPDVPLPPPSP